MSDYPLNVSVPSLDDAPRPLNERPESGTARPTAKRGFRAFVSYLLGTGDIDKHVDIAAGTRRSWTPYLAVNAAVALLLAACAANASRAGWDWAIVAFYSCIALMYFPVAIAMILPGVSRSERIANLIILGLGLFMMRIIHAPIFLTGHDEYLHLVSTQHIVQSEQLFTTNVLFPIGPLFPGLEIMTSALSELSGMSLFWAGMVVLAVTRFIFVGSLFLVYERVTGSDRIAALGAILYMGASTFTFFDTSFAYAGLSIALLVLAMLVQLESSQPDTEGVRQKLALFGVLLTVLLALAMTHHITAYAAAGIFAGFVGLDVVNRGQRIIGLNLICAAMAAVVIPMLWSKAMGNPGVGYLGPTFENGFREVAQLLQFTMTRKLFTGDDGVVAPIWQRYTTLGGAALVCIGLALGFFRSLSWAGLPVLRARAAKRLSAYLAWENSRLVLFTLLTIGFPISMVFRLTRSGWEIGNRIAPFAFIGVGVVLAICVVTFLQKSSTNIFRAAILGVCATIIVVGGIISSEGPRVLVPKNYQISADSASIEPMSINAALWAKQWLGPGNHFAADRVNRLLLSGYGDQLVSTTLKHYYDAGIALASRRFGKAELDVLERLDIEYIFADLRLTMGKPAVGAYFDGAAADQMLNLPPRPKDFLKFNAMSGVNRVFDNGYSVIYDVRALTDKVIK